MKGYKVFNSDWTCRGFQYEVGKTYEMEDELIICEKGFHFCTDPKDCFRYYDFWGDIKIAEIEALGDIDREYMDSKCCTNKIKIIRELSLKDAKIETKIIEENAVFSALRSFILRLPLARPIKEEDFFFDVHNFYRHVRLEVIESITFSEEE